MKHVLKNRNFMLLMAAQFIEQIGDSFMLMALIAWAMSMKEGGSAAANMSILMFWIVLPIVLLGPIAGVFVDMYKKKHIMFITALMRCVFIMLIFALAPFKSMWAWIYFLVFLKSVVSQFFIPAKSSIVPYIVDEKDLLDANSLSATGSIVLQIATYAVAGAVIDKIGYRDSFLINGIIYGIVVLVILFIKTGEKLHREPERSVGRIGTDFAEGLKFLLKEQKVGFVVRRVFLLMMALGFVYVALTGSFLQTVLRETGITRLKEIKALGFVQAFLGLGLVFGVLMLKNAVKWFKEQQLIRSLYPMLGLLVATLYFCQDYYYLLVVAVIGGMAGIMVLSIAETELQKNTPAPMRGRIFSAYYILRSAGLGIATSLTGVIAKWIPEELIVLICGSTLFIYGGITVVIQLIAGLNKHKAKA